MRGLPFVPGNGSFYAVTLAAQRQNDNQFAH